MSVLEHTYEGYWTSTHKNIFGNCIKNSEELTGKFVLVIPANLQYCSCVMGNIGDYDMYIPLRVEKNKKGGYKLKGKLYDLIKPLSCLKSDEIIIKASIDPFNYTLKGTYKTAIHKGLIYLNRVEERYSNCILSDDFQHNDVSD